MTPETTRTETQQQTSDASSGAMERGSDRERSIDTTRERGRRNDSSTSLARRQSYSPGSGAGLAGSPFALMQRMADDMDRLFEQFGFGRTGLGLAPSLDSLLGPAARAQGEALWTPQVEMFQRGEKLVVRADLPGVKKDDLHVDIEDDVLTIRGERREEHEENREGFYRTERSYGGFYRAIPLPEGVNADACEATYRDGVLEITLPAPKPEERRAKRIQVR